MTATFGVRDGGATRTSELTAVEIGKDWRLLWQPTDRDVAATRMERGEAKSEGNGRR